MSHNYFFDLCVLYAEQPYDTTIITDRLSPGITSNTSKRVFAHIYENSGDPEEYVTRENLWAINDPKVICEIVFATCAGLGDKFWANVSKKPNAIGRMVGTVIKNTEGRIEASLVELLGFYWMGRHAPIA